MASRHAFYLLCYFLLGDGLKNAYLPAIFGDGHQNMILLGDLLGVDDLAAVENLLFQLRGVTQLHGGAFRRVEDSIELVAMVNKADTHAGLLLRSHLVG